LLLHAFYHSSSGLQSLLSNKEIITSLTAVFMHIIRSIKSKRWDGGLSRLSRNTLINSSFLAFVSAKIFLLKSSFATFWGNGRR